MDYALVFQKGAEFISRGTFNPRVLLWHTKKVGFFWTREDGRAIDGRPCLTTAYVESHVKR